MVVDDSGIVHVSFASVNDGSCVFAYYAKSTDGGLSFLPPVRACDSLYRTQPGTPSIAVTNTGRTVYVARYERWNGGGPYAIWLARSTDGGSTFLTPNPLVCLDTTKDMLCPTVAAFGDSIVLVAWQDDDTARNRLDIFFSRSRDGGATFGSFHVLSDTSSSPTWARDPSVGVDDSGRVHVAFMGSASPYFISLVTLPTPARRSEPSGNTRPGRTAPIAFVSPGGQLHVSWHTAQVISGPREVYVQFRRGQHVCSRRRPVSCAARRL